MSERSSGASPAVNVSEELSALLQERERYETWIRQLESRVDATPRAVFDRVMSDYRTRLRQVLERVGGRTGELRTQIDALEARLAIVEKEHSEIRDERAEAELRHQVGEYTAGQWAEISAHTDEALNRAVAQRTEVAADVARLREIFAAATASSTVASVPDEPEAGVAASVTNEKQTVPGAETRPAAEASAGQASADAEPRDTVRAEADGRAIVEEAIAAIKPAAGSPAPGSASPPSPPSPQPASAAAPMADAAPAPAAPPASPPPRSTPGGVRRTSGFDDLAFVSSLVNPEDRRTPAAPSPAIPADASPPARTDPRSSAEQRASGIGRASGPETPASFMRGVRGESVKTLKCQECGTLNYPTEWYCERCGGELAAL